jgi:hypothetical protein
LISTPTVPMHVRVSWDCWNIWDAKSRCSLSNLKLLAATPRTWCQCNLENSTRLQETSSSNETNKS